MTFLQKLEYHWKNGKFICLGSDCVMSTTGDMWNPLLAYEIWKKEEENL